MSAKKTGKRFTATKALFLVVATAPWTFMTTHGAMKLATASTSSQADPDDCQDEVAACSTDSTCVACFETQQAGNIETSVTADCVTDYIGSSLSDTCLSTGAAFCCTEWLSDPSCLSNVYVKESVTCIMESIDCSIDNVPCLEGASDALESGGNSVVNEGPISMVKVVVTGTLGLLVTVVALL